MRIFMTYVFENLSKTNKLNYLTVETNNERTGRFYEKKLGFTYFGKKIRFFKFQKRVKMIVFFF